MTRILIRSAKDPFLPLSPEETLAGHLLAGNTGNMLFSQGVHEVLSVPGVEVVADGYVHDRVDPDPETAARIDDEYDAYVIPLANAFRPSFLDELRRLTALVQRLSIPVVVTGVGAQTTPRATRLPPEVRDDTAAFLRAVLERSARVGVRGDITRQCLASLGFGDEHVEVIGCPSLFTPGRQAPVLRRVETLTPDSPLVATVTLSQPRMGRILQRAAERYPHLTYVAQRPDELRLLLRGEPVPGELDATMPTTADHPLYRSDRIRMFVDASTWSDYLADRELCFGTRLHGTIAALVAGTPGFLLTFDSRTVEVADYHGFPHAPLASVSDDVDPAELFARTDLTAFNDRRGELLGRFTTFLDDNGLDHVYRPGSANPGYAARLAAADLPGPVGPRAQPETGRLSRLARGVVRRRPRRAQASDATSES